MALVFVKGDEILQKLNSQVFCLTCCFRERRKDCRPCKKLHGQPYDGYWVKRGQR